MSNIGSIIKNYLVGRSIASENNVRKWSDERGDVFKITLSMDENFKKRGYYINFFHETISNDFVRIYNNFLKEKLWDDIIIDEVENFNEARMFQKGILKKILLSKESSSNMSYDSSELDVIEFDFFKNLKLFEKEFDKDKHKTLEQCLKPLKHLCKCSTLNYLEDKLRLEENPEKLFLDYFRDPTRIQLL